MFELKPTNPVSGTRGGVYAKGRLLLGRAESCDLIVNHDSISAVHAVLEIYDDRAIIYDMNSTNGTFVNGDKVVTQEFRVGDTFRLASVEFEFKKYISGTAHPPVLDTLAPGIGEAAVNLPPLPELPTAHGKTLPKSAPSVSSSQAPAIVYPLEADPKAQFSEYIFEDKNELYPIFKYETAKQAVEIIILFKDSVFSVDYLPESKAQYFITGIYRKDDELEFPYLGKDEKFPFVDVQAAQAVVQTLPGFSILHLGDKKKDISHTGTSVVLTGRDLVRLQKNDLQIFVRNVLAPPKILPAPILKRDPDFRKYLLLFLSMVMLFTVGVNMIEVPVDPKIEELAPERLAAILYKQPLYVNKNKAVEKTKDAPPVAQKAPPKVAVEKKSETKPAEQPKVKNPDVITTKDQNQKPDPGVKTAPVKKIVKQGTKPVTTPTDKIMNSPSAISKTNANNNALSAKSPVPLSQYEAKTQGHVEVYKSADFKSTVSSMVAKGGSLSGVQTKAFSGSGGGAFPGASSGVSTGTGSVKTSDMTTEQGSLVGATTGVLGESKGAGGLSAKRSIYTAGIPSETVVLGSMDPDVIRRILLEHLAQFRYCYQKELEKRGEETSGQIKLNFTIGASGHVAQAGVDGTSALPAETKRCVVGVLKGITFPEPMGGGTVEVKQPMNFYPKRI